MSTTTKPGEHRRFEGETLAAHLDRVGTLAPASAASLGARLAEALVKLHASGHAHGMLDPSHVFLGRHGDEPFVELLPARKGAAPASPRLERLPYLAPESLDGTDGGSLADVYALGVILYRCVAGCVPYEGTDLAELARAIAAGRARPLEATSPAVDASLAKRITRATAFHAADRYPSARELLEDLLEWNEEATRVDGLLSQFLGLTPPPASLPSLPLPPATPPTRPEPAARTTRPLHSMGAMVARSTATPQNPTLRPATQRTVDEETTEVRVQQHRILPLVVID